MFLHSCLHNLQKLLSNILCYIHVGMLLLLLPDLEPQIHLFCQSSQLTVIVVI